MQINENIYPKSNFSNDFSIYLNKYLRENFYGTFEIIGEDLYHNDNKTLTLENDMSINKIIDKLKSILDSEFIKNNESAIQKSSLNQLKRVKDMIGDDIDDIVRKSIKEGPKRHHNPLNKVKSYQDYLSQPFKVNQNVKQAKNK